jgi:hypothetical protein
MSSVTSGVCRGVFICFTCIHLPSSTATFFTLRSPTSDSIMTGSEAVIRCLLYNFKLVHRANCWLVSVIPAYQDIHTCRNFCVTYQSQLNIKHNID